MRRPFVFGGYLTALILAFTVAGCANHSLSCGLGIPSDECLPGTAGYDRAQRIATADAEKCLSYGLSFGTPGYAECREQIASQREARRSAASAALFQQAQQSMTPVQPQPFQQQPFQIHQTTMGNSTFINGSAGGTTFNGTSQTLGNTTYTHVMGTDGSMATCTRQTFGNNINTTCQ